MTLTLKAKDIQEQYGLGRDLSIELIRKLPHASVGRSLMVRRTDVEAFLERAIQDGADLWDLMREHDAGTLRVWMKRAA